MLVCPTCEGRKELEAFYDGPRGSGFGSFSCPTCLGAGEITQEQLERIERGSAMRAEREAAEVGLRERAREMGLTPTELSKMERGELDQPP